MLLIYATTNPILSYRILHRNDLALLSCHSTLESGSIGTVSALLVAHGCCRCLLLVSIVLDIWAVYQLPKVLKWHPPYLEPQPPLWGLEDKLEFISLRDGNVIIFCSLIGFLHCGLPMITISHHFADPNPIIYTCPTAKFMQCKIAKIGGTHRFVTWCHWHGIRVLPKQWCAKAHLTRCHLPHCIIAWFSQSIKWLMFAASFRYSFMKTMWGKKVTAKIRKLLNKHAANNIHILHLLNNPLLMVDNSSF